MNRFAAVASFLMVLGIVVGWGGGASAGTSDFALGADIGWVTEQEAHGAVFRDAAGKKGDPFALLAGLGVNAIRLRVWVNPKDGYNAVPDVLVKAKRAAALGQKIMIDFHYSDGWADPGKQNKPAAWAAHNLAQLQSDVYRHTAAVLTALKDAGISVSWVQVGNEINTGLLWPEGHIPNFAAIAALTNQGYAAVKAVYPDAQVIIHLATGSDGAACRWFLDAFFAAGGKADIIGLSHYPTAANWTTLNAAIAATMADIVTRYAKPVMVVETGFAWDDPLTAKAMIADLVAKTKALGGLGVFYWEPDGFPNWQGYQMGAVNKQGQFTAAMDPL